MTESVAHEGSPSQDPLEEVQPLIEAVQRHPCVYNRYDPLHKVTDYKHEIWKVISIEVGYDGQPVELERKWKHMRDKYVRLRKQDKHKAPIKPTNKWFNYYNRMSFLDPYVEHRNRKSQKEYSQSRPSHSPDELLDDDYIEEFNMKEEMALLKTDGGYESPHTSSSTSSGGAQTDSPPPPPSSMTTTTTTTTTTVTESDDMRLLYDKILKTEETSGEWHSVSSSGEQRASRKRKPIPTQILPETSPTTPPEKVVRQRAMIDDPLKDLDEDQVTLFIRSIARTLVDMDYKKFSMARVEISKVLYNIEYGKTQYPDRGVT